MPFDVGSKSETLAPILYLNRDKKIRLYKKGDNPFEKFFLHDQPKIHSSNYKIGLGTTKPTTAFIPGYGGYVPTNRFEYNMDYIKDPYFNINKTNHLLNYMVRIPNYQGYVPKSVTNIKGNQRPHCFSTEGEDFS